jgi:Na+/proline symporter
MSISLDYCLVACFFLYLLWESVKKSNTSMGINYYAIGNKSFSTRALTSTIVATWVSGSGLVLDLSEFHEQGITYFIASIGMCLNLAIVGYYIAPRVESFLGKTSVATIMGEHYGEYSRYITSLLGGIASCGVIAVQFKIMGEVIHVLLPEINLWLCIFLSAAVVTFYTYSGGIRSVVRTDVIQTICFSISLIVAILMFDKHLNITNKVPLALEKFQFSYLYSLDNAQKIDLLLMFFYFLIPGLKPQVIQRISMAVTIEQAKKAYLYSAAILVVILVLSCWLSYLIYCINPTVGKNEILAFLINNFTITGTKGILIIGVISMCMSTADSALNISAVIIANDFWKLSKHNALEKLYNARIFTIILGLISSGFAINFIDKSLFDIILSAAALYVPAVTVPLFMIIFGFKFTERSVIISMIAGLSFIAIFKWIIALKFNAIVPSMLVNLTFLISSHYLIEKWELLKCFGIRSKLKKNV